MKGNSRHRKYTIHLKAAGIIALAAMLSGCRETAVSAEGPGTATASEAVIIQVPETIAPLGLEGQVLPISQMWIWGMWNLFRNIFGSESAMRSSRNFSSG